jgi:hypothetical protein
MENHLFDLWDQETFEATPYISRGLTRTSRIALASHANQLSRGMMVAIGRHLKSLDDRSISAKTK